MESGSGSNSSDNRCFSSPPLSAGGSMPERLSTSIYLWMESLRNSNPQRQKSCGQLLVDRKGGTLTNDQAMALCGINV